jgi:hypothetical protein
VTAPQRLPLRRPLGADHVLVATQRLPIPATGIQIQHAGGFDSELRVAGKDPRSMLPRFDGILGHLHCSKSARPPAAGRSSSPGKPPAANLLRHLRAVSIAIPNSAAMREREIVIDRVTASCGAEYEWGVHVSV